MPDIPNSTQIHNVILDKWLPILNDVELRVLLIVARQTVGWVWDPRTKMRKKEDWISSGQLVHKTGRGRTAVSGAIKTLIERYHLVVARDGSGKTLENSTKRRGSRGRIYYSLSLHNPENDLFGRPVGKRGRVQKVNTQKVNTTKLTHLTKERLLKIAEMKKSAFGGKVIPFETISI